MKKISVKEKQAKQGLSLLKRFERALGPIGAGMILDMADFLAFGPIGIVFGLLVGAILGWYLTGVLGVPKKWRVFLTWLAAAYCFVPGTELLPLGTLVGASYRFFESSSNKGKDTVS